MTQPAAQRYLALDVLRGMTVCFMIIVNNGGTGAKPYAMLRHVPWHGFTPTDLVYPVFMFVIGNAMAFSMQKFDQMSTGQAVWKILKRTILIFLIGYLMYWYPFIEKNAAGEWIFSPIGKTRILGVLQRIALCYGLAAFMIYFLSRKMVVILSLIFLLGYWLVLYVGGDYSMTGQIGYQIDVMILGKNHMPTFDGVVFENQGLLGTFPATINIIIGYFAGLFIRKKGNGYESISKLMVAGAAMIAVAYIWNEVFPINKKLWTSSYVLYTCGLALLILGSLIFIIEIAGRKKWTWFFTVFGKNPLFIYVFAEVLAATFWTLQTSSGRSWVQAINDVVFQKILPGPNGSLLYAISFMLACWLLGVWMDRKKIYVRV